MVVHNVGSGLSTVFPDLDGKKINDAFLLARPLVEFTWNMVRYVWQRRKHYGNTSVSGQTATTLLLQFHNASVSLIWAVICTQIISHPNNLFEIVSKEPVKRERNLHNRVQSKSGSHANTRRGVFLVLWDLPACGQTSFIAVSNRSLSFN